MFKPYILLFGILIVVIEHINSSAAYQNEVQNIEDILKNNFKQRKYYDEEEGYLQKRSDIDARLLEIQAKILLNRAYQRLPPGHGKFNFKLM